MKNAACLLVLSFLAHARSQKLVLTNDDGWAVAQIRAEYDTLTDAGYDVILSSPAQNWSGSGSLSVPALPTVRPCEFNSCPAFSPAYGSNSSNPRLHYVNAAPSDASHHGVTTLALETWGTKPDLVVSGPNVGLNVGLAVLGSGTIGAAVRAIQDGVPAIAFSGSSTQHEAWTHLDSSPSSPSVIAARTYAKLTTTFLSVMFNSSSSAFAVDGQHQQLPLGHTQHQDPLLPPHTLLSINFPALSAESSCADSVEWILTRAFMWRRKSQDVEICGNGGQLPTEDSVLRAGQMGCRATVTVLDARTKSDAGSDVQKTVLDRLTDSGLVFGCFP